MLVLKFILFKLKSYRQGSLPLGLVSQCGFPRKEKVIEPNSEVSLPKKQFALVTGLSLENLSGWCPHTPCLPLRDPQGSEGAQYCWDALGLTAPHSSPTQDDMQM